jgi:hypothetical protein
LWFTLRLGVLEEQTLPVNVRIESETVEVGTSTTVVLIAEAAAPGITSYTIDVSFDAGLFRNVECVAALGFNVCNPDFAPDAARFVGSFPEGTSGLVTLGSLTFVAGTEAGVSPLEIDVSLLADPFHQDLDFQTFNGSITIVPFD